MMVIALTHLFAVTVFVKMTKLLVMLAAMLTVVAQKVSLIVGLKVQLGMEIVYLVHGLVMVLKSALQESMKLMFLMAVHVKLLLMYVVMEYVILT
tara:strand:- start:142 stop:426 length:285 start_codon:yes stop_codon:yes gene_type:complete